jgi:hypothetical protein
MGVDSDRFYGADLAFIYDVGFGGHARRAAPTLLAILHQSGISAGLVVDLGCGSGIWARLHSVHLALRSPNNRNRYKDPVFSLRIHRVYRIVSDVEKEPPAQDKKYSWHGLIGLEVEAVISAGGKS